MTMKTAVLTALLVSLSSPLNVHGRALHFTQNSRRSTISTYTEDLNGKTFDFVIVGGSAAGLALASRLSESTNNTVAVIEAGDDGSAVMERILVPALTYLEGVAVPGSPLRLFPNPLPSPTAPSTTPASTSSMLLLDKGGVVDATLRVNGTTGLRVVDTPVIPIGLCAHLMGPTYAIAEKAAEMIKATATQYRAPPNLYSGTSHVSFASVLSLLTASVLAVLL